MRLLHTAVPTVSVVAAVAVMQVSSAGAAPPMRALWTCGYGTGTPGITTFTMTWHVNCPGGSNYARAWADCGSLGITHKYGYDYGPTTAQPYRVVMGG
jgi:hypothetical protein